MSVASEITRLQSAKAALKTAINAKNDSSHQIDDETLEDYAGFVDNISTGVKEAPSKDVNFYDYDGKILYSYTASEFAQLTEMPANPTHDGLTSQGWNWSLTDAKAQVTAVGACDIGQMYITDDGKTRLYCHFTDDTKSFYFGIAPNGTVVVDWGDGSATDTLTGTSSTTVVTVQHTYAAAGDYIITLSVSTGRFFFYGTSNTSYLFRGALNTTAGIHIPYLACLKKVELGGEAYPYDYAFCKCQHLSSITIPSGSAYHTRWGTQAFNNCYALRHITFPLGNSFTALPSYIMYYCYGLKSVSLSSKITTLNQQGFMYCYSLSSIVLPVGLTQIGSNVFYGIDMFTKLVIPSTVTSIGSNTFYNCRGMKEYHFKSTAPPTLANTNSFTNMQSDCVIYVPSAKLNDYKTASNWNTYASQMVGE